MRRLELSDAGGGQATLALGGLPARLAAVDLAASRRLQAAAGTMARRLACAIGRLGDGWIWLAVAAALPLLGTPSTAREALVDMVVVFSLGLPLYKTLKRATARVRPCHAPGGLSALAPPLDRFSFPSGHTLHAVAMTVVLVGHHPALAWVLVPFALLTALSRIVLGLHYPTDVLAGAGLGALIALVARAL